jgi:drug/metabolite transporter (DMT)-like permease
MPLLAATGLWVACLLWAASFIATKVAVAAVPPLTLVTLRLAISSLCFLAWFALRRRPLRPGGWQGLWRIFVLSLFGTGLHYGIQTIGLQYTTASNASIYAVTGPISITLIAAAVLGERITLRKGVGIAVALAGVLVVMGIDAVASFDFRSYVVGDLLVFLSIVMWGVFTVYGKRLSGQMGALDLLAMTTLVGSAWMLPVGWAELCLRGFSLAQVTAEAWAAIAFLGVTCSFLATLLYFLALARTESQKVGIYLYTIPPMTYVVAALYLGESPGANLLVGSALVLLGVYLTERG